MNRSATLIISLALFGVMPSPGPTPVPLHVNLPIPKVACKAILREANIAQKDVVTTEVVGRIFAASLRKEGVKPGMAVTLYTMVQAFSDTMNCFVPAGPSGYVPPVKP